MLIKMLWQMSIQYLSTFSSDGTTPVESFFFFFSVRKSKKSKKSNTKFKMVCSSRGFLEPMQLLSLFGQLCVVFASLQILSHLVFLEWGEGGRANGK